jgi:hypothetical protein
MFFIVPESDKTADGFVIHCSDGPVTVALPLTTNTTAVLLPVARWLSFPRQRGTKAELIAWINEHLSVRSMADAVARWPALETTANPSVLKALVRQITKETPEFAVHAQVVLEAAEAAARTAAMEAARERERLFTPPAWLEWATEDAPEGPHIVVRISEAEQEHDGYCSEVGEDDLEEREAEEREMYLPPTDEDGDPWDFETKPEWREYADGHCCCGASVITRIVSAVTDTGEKVPTAAPEEHAP